jgi:hypothetical protein
MMWVLDGATPQARVEKGLLTCADWSGGSCAAGTGRYSLAVAKERQPDLGQKLLRAIWPVILPFE